MPTAFVIPLIKLFRESLFSDSNQSCQSSSLRNTEPLLSAKLFKITSCWPRKSCTLSLKSEVRDDIALPSLIWKRHSTACARMFSSSFFLDWLLPSLDPTYSSMYRHVPADAKGEWSILGTNNPNKQPTAGEASIPVFVHPMCT